jgi:hypothetical protein
MRVKGGMPPLGRQKESEKKKKGDGLVGRRCEVSPGRLDAKWRRECNLGAPDRALTVP